MLAQLMVSRARMLPGVVAACAAMALALGSAAAPAQLSAQGGGGGRRMIMTRRSVRRPGMMRMMSDPAARLLDQQSVLQLEPSQVNQLIALHEAARTQQRTLATQLRALFPRDKGQRTAPSAAQRDSAMSLFDALRTARWRETAAADSILTPDQRRTVARLATEQHSMMGRGRFGNRGMIMRDGGGMRGGPMGRGPGNDQAPPRP